MGDEPNASVTSTAKRLRRKSGGRFLKTPYSAVRKRKINFVRPLSVPRQANGSQISLNNLSNAQSAEYFKDIPKLIWRTHFATPLYKFKSDEASLKRYARYLCCHILSEKYKNTAFNPETSDSQNIKVDISVKKYSQDGEKSVSFLVKDGKGKTHCHVMLCCFDFKHHLQFLHQSLPSYTVPDSDHKAEFDANFTVLPLVLTKGLVSTQNAVINWIKLNFDCKITPLKFNAIELSWMASMWTKAEHGTKERDTKFIWEVPQSNNLKKMSASIKPDSIRKIWDSCCSRDKENTQLSAEDKDKFISLIEKQLTRTFTVKITSLPLIEIDTTIAAVKAEGKVKIWSRDHCYTVLSHLTCLCTERLGVAY